MQICIVCQKNVEGKPAVPVKEDFVIRSIRRAKTFLNIAQNNELFVCEDDLEAHRKRRKEFERSLVLFGVLAAIVVIVLLATLLMSGTLDIIAFLSAIAIGLFILLFAFVFKYAPALDVPVPAEGPEWEEEEPAKAKKPPLPEELEGLEEGAGAPPKKARKAQARKR